jgi:hypothetical protein
VCIEEIRTTCVSFSKLRGCDEWAAEMESLFQVWSPALCPVCALSVVEERQCSFGFDDRGTLLLGVSPPSLAPSSRVSSITIKGHLVAATCLHFTPTSECYLLP